MNETSSANVPPHQVAPEHLIPGKRYRIHRIGQNHGMDSIGTFERRGVAPFYLGTAMEGQMPIINWFNDILHGYAPIDGVYPHRRDLPPTLPLGYGDSLNRFYETGETIATKKVISQKTGKNILGGTRKRKKQKKRKSKKR